MLHRTILACLAAVLLAACDGAPQGAGSSGTATPRGSTGPSAPATVTPHEHVAAPERSGGALMRSADGARLYLADEDHHVVRVLPLPFGAEPPEPAPAASASASPAPAPSVRPSASASTSVTLPDAPAPSSAAHLNPPPPDARQAEISVPGAPAQVLPLDGYVLVTLRDPGLLLVLKEEPDNNLKEEARIPLPADAWGLAVTRDETVAVVTSAWTHKVTGVDWRARKALWTLDVAREPRAVVIHPDGKTAYVSHLTSSDLTRIDEVASPGARASTVHLPAAPARTPLATAVQGSLGYALVLDDAGNRLLAARHALGALAWMSWFGIPTIDVLQTGTDQPLLGPRTPGAPIKSTPAFEATRAEVGHNPEEYRVRQFSYPTPETPRFAQPRAMIVAHRTQTVWLASEGYDSVAEFPLLSAAPMESRLRTVSLGRGDPDPRSVDVYGTAIDDSGGAPTGLALNRDETLLYVFCRSTYDVITVRLAGVTRNGRRAPITRARVASDPLDDSGARGRRFFYTANDSVSSEGMGCAGCHPEGRDDGHVWHEVLPDKDHKSDSANFLAGQNLAFKTHDGKLGFPRQTPMLAGRVNAKGPFGWHAQDATLLERLAEGFGRHRWRGTEVSTKHWMTGERVNALVPFLRKGLVPPPRPERELTEEEKRGKEIFASPKAQCTKCHDPATELTDRVAYPLSKLAPPPGFEDEEDTRFKTPSLLFVGGTPPYFHDGHAATLSALVDANRDRMGKTSHLTAAERAALVAYLETL